MICRTASSLNSGVNRCLLIPLLLGSNHSPELYSVPGQVQTRAENVRRSGGVNCRHLTRSQGSIAAPYRGERIRPQRREFCSAQRIQASRPMPICYWHGSTHIHQLTYRTRPCPSLVEILRKGNTERSS